MSGAIHNVCYIKNGTIVQFDDIIATGSHQVEPTPEPTPEPAYTLPPMTLRFRFNIPDYDPTPKPSEDTEDIEDTKGTWTKCTESADENIWDWTYDNPIWDQPFGDYPFDVDGLIVELIDCGDTSQLTTCDKTFYTFNPSEFRILKAFDTSNVTSMSEMFSLSTITEVPLFNTSNVTDFNNMFSYCRQLTQVPNFDTSKGEIFYCMFGDFESESGFVHLPLIDVSNAILVYNMFNNCPYVETGMVEMYERLKVAPKIEDYENCFSFCGTETESGLAARQQIPKSWGGDKED